MKQLTKANENGIESGFIETSHRQGWKTVALMRGLGFEIQREEMSDIFYTYYGSVKGLYDGWIPSSNIEGLYDWYPTILDGSNLYVRVFYFSSKDGHENVIAWNAQSNLGNRLFSLIGLSSKREWDEEVNQKNGSDGLKIWLKHNQIFL